MPFTGTRNVARITAPTATLPGGPNWQLSVSNSGRLTGPDAPVVAEVVYAGTGATAADFPAGTAGKIVLLDQGANTAARNTQVANAVAAGAAAVIVGATANNASPPTVTVTPAQPTIPIVGGGRAHLDWIKGLLAAGPLTLRLATLNNVNYPRTNVIGVRKAVGDPTGTTAPIVMVGAHIEPCSARPAPTTTAPATASRRRSRASSASTRSTRRSASAAGRGRKTATSAPRPTSPRCRQPRRPASSANGRWTWSARRSRTPACGR